MEDNSDIESETMQDLMRYAFLRLDGAWFMAATDKFGIEVATDLDKKTWETFSERLGKRIASLINLDGEFSQVVPKLMKIHHDIMKMNSEFIILSENKALHRVLDCEIWRMVQKVWTRDTIPCHKVTLASIKGLLKGAFPEKEFILEHKKKIPLGDPYCEIEITLKNT